MAVIIVPDKGMAGEIGRQLLELAEHPSQVQWVSWPQGGFKVSEELAKKFNELPETSENAPDEAISRRRGRPRKQPVTDDTGKGE